MFHAPNATGGRKRAFVPKHMKKHGNEKDAKRRKLDDGTRQDRKKFNKSGDKDQQKNVESKGDKKFGGKFNKNADQSQNTKKVKKTKVKKSKGKKKSHRNKNK